MHHWQRPRIYPSPRIPPLQWLRTCLSLLCEKWNYKLFFWQLHNFLKDKLDSYFEVVQRRNQEVTHMRSFAWWRHFLPGSPVFTQAAVTRISKHVKNVLEECPGFIIRRTTDCSDGSLFDPLTRRNKLRSGQSCFQQDSDISARTERCRPVRWIMTAHFSQIKLFMPVNFWLYPVKTGIIISQATNVTS